MIEFESDGFSFFFSFIYFLKKIGVTFCQFPFPIYYFNNKKFLHVSAKFFSFPVVLYRSEKTSKTLTRETGNVEDNRANDNGAVEVGEGELEAAFCSSDDCREVIEDLETNKTLNEDNLLDGDTKLDKENTSEGDELMHRDSTSKEDDALNDWNDERGENEGACNKNITFSKKCKKTVCGEAILGKIWLKRKGTLFHKKVFYLEKYFFILKSYITIS